IDRRVVMIRLFATDVPKVAYVTAADWRSNRQVPSLEVGDMLNLFRCCHAVQRIAWTRTNHRFPSPQSSNTDGTPETRLPRTTADFRTWPRRCAPRFPAAPDLVGAQSFFQATKHEHNASPVGRAQTNASEVFSVEPEDFPASKHVCESRV